MSSVGGPKRAMEKRPQSAVHKQTDKRDTSASSTLWRPLLTSLMNRAVCSESERVL